MRRSARCAACSPAPWRASRSRPAMLSERLGMPLVLAAGTALAGLGYCLALFVGSYPALIAILLVVGARREHAASARLRAGGARVLRARARSVRSAPTISPAISARWRCPAAASLLVVLMPWRLALALLGAVGSRGCGCDVAARAALPRGSGAGRRASRRQAGAEPARGGFPMPALDRRDRLGDAHGPAHLPAVPAHRERRIAADYRAGADAGVRRRRRRQARLRLDRRAHRRGRDRVAHRRASRRSASWRCCRCRSNSPWCCCPRSASRSTARRRCSTARCRCWSRRRRARAPSASSTPARSASGAIAPIFYGLIGDAFGVPLALVVVAALVLATLPLVLVIRHGSPRRRPPDGFQLLNPRRRKSGVLLRFCQRAGNSVRALARHERLKRSLSWRNGGEFHGTGP